MTDFAADGYVLVRQFLDPQSIATISQYLENTMNRYPENNQGGYDDVSNNKISWYADPLIQVVLQNSMAEVEGITNLQLYPSHSFTRVYQQGNNLKPHVDRGECEISVTCNIATKGEPWPIYMKAPGKEPVAHYLEPGDACVYKGCDVLHWRNKAVDTDINVQIMLHYVDKNGPYAGRRFDNRKSLNSFKRV